MRMRTINLACLVGLLCLVVISVSLCDPMLAAEETTKVVRLIWFPRFSPDNKWVISAHGSWEEKEAGEVRVLDAESGKEKFVVSSDRGVRTVGWSATGKWFASGNYGGVLQLHDSQTAKRISEMKFASNVEVLQFSPDDKQLITAHGEGSIVISELPSLKQVYALKNVHREGIWGMKLAPDGNTLATAGKDGFVRLFDLQTRELKHELPHPTQTNGVEFTSDTKELLTGCLDSKIRFFDVASGRLLRTLTAHGTGSVTDIGFSPDDKLLASSGMDKTVRLWNTSNLEKPKLKSTLLRHDDMVFGVDISADGKWLVSAGWDEKIQLWDLANQKQKWTWHR